MQAFPPEVVCMIFKSVLGDVTRREQGSKARGKLARVCKKWRLVLYETGELWNVSFVHFRMDIKHIQLVCRLAVGTGERARAHLPILHVSTEDEDEPDAATLKECGSPEALAEWLAAVAGFLAPVVAHAKSLTIDSTTPLGVSAILTSIGVQQASNLEQLTCYSYDRHSDNVDYLQSVVSRQLQSLSITRINPIGLAPCLENQSPNLLHNVTALHLYMLTNLTWDQMKMILRSPVALQELDVWEVECSGDPGTEVVHLPQLRSLAMDDLESGGLQLAAFLSMPAIENLTVNAAGGGDGGWRRLLDFEDVIRRVKTCRIGSWQVLANSLIRDPDTGVGKLTSARLIDLSSCTDTFLAEFIRTRGLEHPRLENVKRWIVRDDITRPQAKVLLTWPGSAVEAIYAKPMDEEGDWSTVGVT
ncbi:hypothetical protein R3P38DRAFT_2809108 [Favolaschia claudopus]|uniref:F-box domain-containing protein n=1 Tax=Favolaschia claudopus TaxID=2862362 RepID=A0AAV9ZDW4_9AGAR